MTPSFSGLSTKTYLLGVSAQIVASLKTAHDEFSSKNLAQEAIALANALQAELDASRSKELQEYSEKLKAETQNSPSILSVAPPDFPGFDLPQFDPKPLREAMDDLRKTLEKNNTAFRNAFQNLSVNKESESTDSEQMQSLGELLTLHLLGKDIKQRKELLANEETENKEQFFAQAEKIVDKGFDGLHFRDGYVIEIRRSDLGEIRVTITPADSVSQ